MSGGMLETNQFNAFWTARGNNLCLGHWEISYLGNPLQLEPGIRQNDMGTYAIYSFFDPEDAMFAEGLQEDDWIVGNVDWLANLFRQNGVPISEENMRAFYRAVNLQDWRCGSCGGCI
jgi:hypothetical protein